MAKYIVIGLFALAGITLYYTLETPVVYKDIKGNICKCWVGDYAFPSKDQCKLVGKNYELVTVAKCD